MGLLDAFNDPQMAMAMGLLQAGGPSRMPVSLGQAMGQGYQAYSEAEKEKQRKELEKQKMEQARGLYAMQLQEHQAKINEAKRLEDQNARLAAFNPQQFIKSPADQALAGGEGPTVANANKLPGLTTQVDRAGLNAAMMSSGIPSLQSAGIAGYERMDEKEMAREQAKALLAVRLEESKRAAMAAEQGKTERAQDRNDLMRSNAEQANLTRQAILGRKSKMPPSIVKLQNEELDALEIASGIKSDLGAVVSQLETGKLKLGPIENQESKLKNFANRSDENSRNYGSFTSSMEKLRNDSLRLNKGTQTEGDAVRAWNEIAANLNDQKFVEKRLKEVIAINERAANYRKLNIDRMREEYSLDPLDYSKYDSPKSSIGSGATADWGGTGGWSATVVKPGGK